MNLDFPSRFLKKLEIYQQIRSGQGISKHKHLWKYEAAFLQCSYGRGHQHLSNFFTTKDVIANIKTLKPDCPSSERHHIITNLFWRGYINAVFVDKVNKNNKRKVMKEKLLDRYSEAFTSDILKSKVEAEKYFFQPTIDGLLVGEILSEINNKNTLLKFWNNYIYDFILDVLWLIAILAATRFVFGETFVNGLLDQIKVSWKVVYFNSKISLSILILILPFISRLGRGFYSCIESKND